MLAASAAERTASSAPDGRLGVKLPGATLPTQNHREHTAELGYRQGRRNRQGLLYGDPIQFGTKLEQSQMVGILALERAH
jgi:hypothetical protein